MFGKLFGRRPAKHGKDLIPQAVGRGRARKAGFRPRTGARQQLAWRPVRISPISSKVANRLWWR
jgi:hypothetical protein